MAEFVKIVGNCEINGDGEFEKIEPNFTTYEIIRLDYLEKIYEYLPKSNVLVYVWRCPVTGCLKETRELFSSYWLMAKKKEFFEEKLCGVKSKYD